MRHLTNKQKLLLGVIGVGGGAVVADQLLLAPSASSAAAMPVESAPAAPVAPRTVATTSAKPDQSTGPDLRDLLADASISLASLEGVRDAFHREPPPIPEDPKATAIGERKARQPTGISLTSVLVGANGSVAVINGRMYRVGHVVDQYTIVAIDEFEVTLERDGERVTIRVPVKGQSG